MRARFDAGFTLIEMLFAMSITMGIGMIAFQLFIQNENIFQDQNRVLEMQQSTRAVASMITDDLRIAGQGVPIYSQSLDGTPSEATQTFVNGTGSGTVIFRSSVANASATVGGTPPLIYEVGTAATITVDSNLDIFGVIGANDDRYLFLWGPTDSSWTWVRARITNSAAVAVNVTPSHISTGGGTFASLPHLVVEEAVAYRLNGDDIQRGTSGDWTTVESPTITYSTVGEGFNGLTFTYYDGSNNIVTANTLANRATIRRVDFTLSAETADEMTNGSTRTYAISMSIYPRNVALY